MAMQKITGESVNKTGRVLSTFDIEFYSLEPSDEVQIRAGSGLAFYVKKADLREAVLAMTED